MSTPDPVPKDPVRQALQKLRDAAIYRDNVIASNDSTDLQYAVQNYASAVANANQVLELTPA